MSRYRRLLFVALLAVMGLATVLVWRVGDWRREAAAKDYAYARVRAWGAALMSGIADGRALLVSGRITREDEALLRRVSRRRNVFRYAVVNASGIAIMASRPELLGEAVNTRDYWSQVRQGRTVTRLSAERFDELSPFDPARPPTVAVVHMPVTEKGRFRGMLIGYVDVRGLPQMG